MNHWVRCCRRAGGGCAVAARNGRSTAEARRTSAGRRFAQIHRGNVAKLRLAWTFDTGDAFQGSEMQCNPMVVDGVLYATTPKLRVFALDAATGKQIWRFDPERRRARRSGRIATAG